MHIRIGGPDASLIGALREGGANRTSTPAAESAGDNGGGSAAAGSGVVIRLSPEARQQMAEQSNSRADTAAAPEHANEPATEPGPAGEIGDAQPGEKTEAGTIGAKPEQDNGPAKPLSTEE